MAILFPKYSLEKFLAQKEAKRNQELDIKRYVRQGVG